MYYKMCFDIITAIATLVIAAANIIIIYFTIVQKPLLAIEFKQEEPFCRESYIPIDIHIAKKQLGRKRIDKIKKYLDEKNEKCNDPNVLSVPGYWVRIRVTNTGKKPAYRCVGKLVEILNEKGETIKEFDPVILHWVSQSETRGFYKVYYKRMPIYSVSRLEKFEPINLGLGDYQYLDILWIEFGDDHFHINCPEAQSIASDRGIKVHYEPGIYYLKILITSDNAKSTEIELKVEWNGKWSGIKVSEVGGRYY